MQSWKIRICIISAMILPALSFLLFALTFVMNPPTADNAAVMANNTNPVTSHVLDIARGRPAQGIKITFFKMQNNDFLPVTEQVTNADGRVGNLISAENFLPGVYKLRFDTLSYYQKLGEKTFYPHIEVVFQIEAAQEHYHVPILLSAYGYSTYRGS